MVGKKIIRAIIFSLSMTSIVMLNCKGTNLPSYWRDREIVIDGFQTDWEGMLINLPDNKVNIGIANDAEFLYLCLVPLDQAVARQALSLGMTAWFEGNSGNKIGVLYPLGIPIDEINPKEFKDNKNKGLLPELLDKSLKELQIIDKDKKTLARISSVNLMGINAHIGDRHGRFVYELKIPLWITSDYPYAVNASTGDEIKIKIETEEIDFSSLRKKPMNRQRPDEAMRPPGGIGGEGMRPGGGMGGGFNRPQIPERLKLEMKVKLAESDIIYTVD